MSVELGGIFFRGEGKEEERENITEKEEG